MFQGFSKATGDFFWELAFNNEREWFMAHKQQFEDVVNTPFKALAKDTFALMDDKYPDRGLLLHTARIYRDARRLHGRGPYKDHLWFSIKASDGLLSGPMFWFEFGAADYSYGMGFYSATAAQMEAFRRAVDANPARFERIAAPIMDDPRFRITGEEYARPKGKHEGEIVDRWYNRRRIGIEVSRDFGGELLSDTLPETLVDTYDKLMPMYEFFLEFYQD